MEQLTSDLRGDVIYLDDILVSGASTEEHLQNLRALLQRLRDKGLRCNLDKHTFAQASVGYLGYKLSGDGVAKERKVEAVAKIPPPNNVTSLRSFPGSVQFYSKFIHNLSTVTQPLTCLTRKETPWRWAFKQLQDTHLLTSILHNKSSSRVTFSMLVLGPVLVHRYKDGTERPIANA